jgi:hypothetical protein
MLKYRSTTAASRLVAFFLAMIVAACSAHTVQARQSPAPAATTDCNRPVSVLDQGKLVIPQIRTQETQARIAVHVTAAGRADRVHLVKSSGFPQFDFAEESIYMRSTYSPAISHCKPVASWYVFAVTYSSNYDETKH